MDSLRKKTEWSSAHAQLWTSFKRSSSGTDVANRAGTADEVPSEGLQDVRSRTVHASPGRTEVLQLERRLQQLEHEIETRDNREAEMMNMIAKAIAKIDRSDQASTAAKDFKVALEERISATESLAFADAAGGLLASITDLEERVRRLAEIDFCAVPKESSLPFKNLCELVGGPTFASRCTTCSEAASAIAMYLNEAQGSASPSKRSTLTAALATAPPTSFAGLLRLSTANRVSPPRGVDNLDSSQIDMRRVVDLLGGDAEQCPNLGAAAADLALAKCRELEESRRDVGTLSILLSEFERSAQRTLRNVGVGVLPSVKGIRAQLSGSIKVDEELVPASKGGEEGPEWIGKRIAHLHKICQDAAARHSVVDQLTIPSRQGPKASTADTDAKICRRAADDAITIVDDTIRSLVSTNIQLKEAMHRVLAVCERFFAPPADQLPRVSFAQDAPLSVVMSRCDSIIETSRLIEGTFFKACEPILAKFKGSQDGMERQPTNIHDTCAIIVSAVEIVNRAAECSGMSRDDLARLGEAFNTLSVELDARWGTIRETLLIDDDDEQPKGPIESVFVRVSSILLHIPRLRDWIQKEKSCAEDVVNDALHKLSQLIVPVHGTEVAVAPPVESLDELVTALHDRFNALHLYQSKHHGRVHSARHDHLRLEEQVSQRCQRWNMQLRKVIASSAGQMEGEIDTEDEHAQVGVSPEAALDALEQTIQSTRSRLSKAISTQKADRVRIENYQTSHDSWSRKWQQACGEAASLAAALGVQVSSDVRNDDPRPILKQCTEFVSSQEHFTEASTSAATIRVLQEKIVELGDEKLKTEGAVDHITERLIEIAKIMKHALFFIGCDEEAVDEEIENAKYDHEPLACVLSKLARWVVRLDENINYLMDENKIIVKYFSAIHKHVSAEQAEVHDSNLLDMKDTLLLLTQHVLDSVDQLLSGSTRSKGSREGDDPRYRSELLGYDDRLARIHGTICKIHSAMEGISRVTYLSLHQRGGGNDEPSSPTRQSVGFIDVDLSAMSNDDLLRIIDKNASFVKNSVASFGSSFKHMNILVQKDVDAMQQGLCEIFGSLSEIELEKAFPINREEMFQVFNVMSERSLRQKGQYFFDGGDNVAPWVAAVKMLANLFPSMIDKLHDRIKRLAEVYGTLEKIAVSVCRYRAASGDLVATTAAPLDSDGKEMTGDGAPTLEGNSPVVTFDISDEDLPEMVEEMCRVALGSTSIKGQPSLDEEFNRLQEQLQVLQEKVVVTEKKLQTAQSSHEEEKAAVELERDRAFSEAATLRSQLRRLNATRSAPSTQEWLPRSLQKGSAEKADGDTLAARPTSPPKRSSHGAMRAATASAAALAAAPAIPLSAVESYMRNLQRELQSRHLCNPGKGTPRQEAPNLPKKRHQKEVSPSPSRSRHPHTLLSSPRRHSPSAATHGDECDTCEKRARSASSARSRSAPRAVVFNIPGPDDSATNRHASLAHYTVTTPFNTNPRRAATPKPQHHVVVVSPTTAKRTTTAKSRDAENVNKDNEAKQAVLTLVERLRQPPESSPHRLVNLDSDGMRKFVGAFGQRSTNM